MKRKSRVLTLLLVLNVMLAYMPVYLADEVYATTSSGQWKKAGSGTQYYAEFPEGYYKSSYLYGKYNKGKLSPYENSARKREVSTTRVNYIYWHWTWNASVSTEQNNKLIDDKQGYDGQHDYQYFTDFESAENYPVWSGDSRVHEYWRYRAEDGSKWWFQIPVYQQTYTDYEFVASGESSNNNNSNSNSNSDASSASKKSNSEKYTPKKTSVNTCNPKKSSCSMRWKRCSGKCTGYQIRYSTNKDFRGCKIKRIKGRSNCICSLTGLKAGTTYYYQIRCYRVVGKKTYCSKWSKCRSFKTKSAPKAKSSSKSRYMPTEYYVKYYYPYDGQIGTNIKLKYNKYGNVTKMYFTYYLEDGSTDTRVHEFKYTYNKNKTIKTAKASLWGDKQPFTSVNFNKYGVVTSGRWGRYSPLKIRGKASYYGNKKIKKLIVTSKDPADGFSWNKNYYFNKAGYLTKDSDKNGKTKYSYDKKGRLTREYSKDRLNDVFIHDFKYTYKKGRVNTRREYFSDKQNDGQIIRGGELNTITVKKWKKIKVNDNSLRSGRCLSAVWSNLLDDSDPDEVIPTFVYELK